MSDTFKQRVNQIVLNIPSGKVMYYSQIALIAGKPRAARAVGMIAHYGKEEVPWHRIVNKQGGLASGYWGGKREQARLLRAEGIEIKDYKVINMEEYLWQPKH